MTGTEGTAEALLERADELVRSGDLIDASRLIGEAAELFGAAGDSEQHARIAGLAATAARYGGAVEEAIVHARTASDNAASDSRVAVQAAAEVAEAHVAAGQHGDAVDAFTAALDLSAPGDDAVRAVLVRKRGLAHAAMGDTDPALEDLGAATEAFGTAGMGEARRAVLVEAATLASEHGSRSRAISLRKQARSEAGKAADEAVLADVDLLEASLAVKAGDLVAASELTERSRQRSLDAVLPLKYIAAAFALSELEDIRGDRVAAYEVLSTAWATLGDLMGRDTARAIVQPRLHMLIERWGTAEFAAAKVTYEARRRAEMAGGV